jgi:hypothetical protein
VKASWSARRICRVLAAPVLAAPLLMVGVLGAPGAASASPSASSCADRTTPQPPNPGDTNIVTSVAVLSSCNAWAVGWYNLDDVTLTLIEHWNGTAWKQVASPSPGRSGESDLFGVRAVSATNIWAVGTYIFGAGFKTLVLHWNGTVWKRVASPNPATSSGANGLNDVAAPTARNAWAVGSRGNKTLILHWNGTAWKKVASPSARRSSRDVLSGVAASSRSGWAVGSYDKGKITKTLILRWNGTAWKRVASPDPGSFTSTLLDVRAVSRTNAWAVGTYSSHSSNGRERTLILHWNGTVWKRVASPDPGSRENYLTSVAVISATNVLAVGADSSHVDGTAARTLVLRWNGTRWRHLVSANPGGSAVGDVLTGVAASSAANIWVVGVADRSALALHRH